MINKKLVLFSFFSIICGSKPVVSSPNKEEVPFRLNQVIAFEEEYEKQLQQQFRDHHPPEETEVQKVQKKEGDLGTKFVFHAIKITGADLLSEDEKKELVRDYIGKPIPLSDLNEILRVITEYYLDKGYVTTRAYLTPQDLKSGVLEIAVIEGTTSSLCIVDEYGVPQSKLHCIPAKPGAVTNIRDLEQGIDQITRMPTYDAQIEIKPGNENGSSDVVIKTSRKYPFSFNTSYDNYGLKTTGNRMGEVQITVDDLLNIYDSWSFALRRNVDSEDMDHYSRSYILQGSIPFGYWTLRYSGSLFHYLSTVMGQLQSFRFSGNSYTHRMEIEHMLHRNAQGKTGVLFFLNHKNYRNYVQKSLLLLGSQRLTPAGGRLFHNRRLWGGALSAALTYTQGLRILGALRNKNTPRKGAKPQFQKICLDLGYTKPFHIVTQEWVFSSHFSGQYSRQSLFGSERISFGGPQTVRGFQETCLTGNTGFYVHNDLAFMLVDFEGPRAKAAFGKLMAFVGFDSGWIAKDKFGSFERGILRSASIGLRLNGSVAIGELVVGKSLARPGFLKNEGVCAQFKFGITF